MDKVIGLLQSVRPQRDSSLSDRLSYYYTTMWLGMLAVFTLGWSFVGRPIQCWFPAYYKGLQSMDYVLGLVESIRRGQDVSKSDVLCFYCTPILCLVFATFTLSWEFVGQPIACWFPAYYSGFWVQYALDYCFVQNTYFLPMVDAPARNYWELGQQLVHIPQNITHREDKLIGYYQWVGFFLAIEGIMFYLPVVLWRSMYSLTGIKVESICETLTNSENLSKSKREDNVKKVAKFLDSSIGVAQRKKFEGVDRMGGTYLTALYLFIKVLYCVNCLLQYLLLKQFLGVESHFWGVQVLGDLFHGREWMETGHFPRVTMCDFEVRVLGNLHRHTVQCVLMINMFNEKIFLFLWWWFLIVFVVSCFSLLYWIASTTVLRSGSRLVRSYIDRADPPQDAQEARSRSHDVADFTKACLARDGLTLLQLASENAGDLVCNEVVELMWRQYKAGQMVIQARHPPPPSVTGAAGKGGTNGYRSPQPPPAYHY